MEKKKEKEEVLTVEEVAKLFRVKIKTVYHWCKIGEIPHTKIGRTYRFKRSSILQLLK
jgi:excisionase family DNA binding protein